MNNQRKFILIAAAVGIVGAFLPWISVSAGAFGVDMSQSVNGFHGIGILYVLAMAAAAGVAAMGDQKNLLDKNMRLAAIGAGAVAIIALLIAFTQLKSETGGMGGLGLVDVSMSYGYYLSLLAAIATTAVPFVIKNADESFAGDLALLKGKVQTIQTNMATPAATTEAPAAPAAPVAAAPNRMAELEKLIAMRDEGKITPEEFEDLKAKII